MNDMNELSQELIDYANRLKESTGVEKQIMIENLPEALINVALTIEMLYHRIEIQNITMNLYKTVEKLLENDDLKEALKAYYEEE